MEGAMVQTRRSCDDFTGGSAAMIRSLRMPELLCYCRHKRCYRGASATTMCQGSIEEKRGGCCEVTGCLRRQRQNRTNEETSVSRSKKCLSVSNWPNTDDDRRGKLEWSKRQRIEEPILLESCRKIEAAAEFCVPLSGFVDRRSDLIFLRPGEQSTVRQMFPTPSLAHLTPSDYKQVYEPAEDTFLLLDALEQDVELLTSSSSAASPSLPRLVVEIG